jgi:hypothetical protein
VGEMLEGGYVQFGYNVLSQFRENIAVTPFYRFESLDTHARVAPGTVRDTARDRTFHTIGVSLNPIQNVTLKADYQVVRDEADSGVNQFNVVLGYSF